MVVVRSGGGVEFAEGVAAEIARSVQAATHRPPKRWCCRQSRVRSSGEVRIAILLADRSGKNRARFESAQVPGQSPACPKCQSAKELGRLPTDRVSGAAWQGSRPDGLTAKATH